MAKWQDPIPSSYQGPLYGWIKCIVSKEMLSNVQRGIRKSTTIQSMHDI